MKISKLFIFVVIFSVPELYTNGETPSLDTNSDNAKPPYFYVIPTKKNTNNNNENTNVNINDKKHLEHHKVSNCYSIFHQLQ
jgi:hypothetical protein